MFLLFPLTIFCQDIGVPDNSINFFFDAVVFKSDDDSTGRVDVYIIVPYHSLRFIKSDNLFSAVYEANIKITDESGNRVENKIIPRTIIEKEYLVTQSANGEFDYSQNIFKLPKGRYQIDVNIDDKRGNKSFQRTRNQTIVEFNKYPFSISGLMLVSSIEENNGKFVVTPHISDNIGDLGKFFFCFFESYNFAKADSADFVYEILNDKKDIIFKSSRQRFSVSGKSVQHYLRIDVPEIMAQGTYVLRVLALKPSSKQDYTQEDYVATSERSIKYSKSIGGNFVQDLDQAIKQLKYVATSSEIDHIEAGTNLQEKQFRFEEYWKKLDPSPNTERNEAFDEFYYRIDYANKNFKSYTDGWRTDMGMVYVIFGHPANYERSRLSDGRNYERWYYTDRQIIFIDHNGFGDYRLYSPLVISEKYRYH